MAYLKLSYDMRAPGFGASLVDSYKAALDQCEWADKLGFNDVAFLEHHATTDGYLPSPIVMAAAAAARTKQIGIDVVMQLPVYHPLRAAEDLAVLDIISAGRVKVTAVAGYRAEEYAQFGLDFRKRPSLMERNVLALKQAWTGEAFEYEGQTVRILPRPAQDGGPKIELGGRSKAAAERAARIADGYRPVAPEFYEDYRDALREMGKPVPEPLPKRDSYMFLHVSKDPARDWARIAPHAMHENNDYARWIGGLDNPVYSSAEDAQALWDSGRYKVVTPQECIRMAKQDGALWFKPLPAGLDPALAWESLRLFEAEVLPHIR